MWSCFLHFASLCVTVYDKLTSQDIDSRIKIKQVMQHKRVTVRQTYFNESSQHRQGWKLIIGLKFFMAIIYTSYKLVLSYSLTCFVIIKNIWTLTKNTQFDQKEKTLHIYRYTTANNPHTPLFLTAMMWLYLKRF